MLADACHELGTLAAQIGPTEDALVSYRQALALRQALVDKNPEQGTYRRALAKTYTAIGQLDHKAGRYDEAESTFQEALRIQQTLVSTNPDNAEYTNDLAGIHSSLGSVYNLIGKPDLAESNHRTAVTLRDALVRDHRDNETYRRDLASTHHDLGNYEFMASRVDRAEIFYRRALILREALARSHPDNELYQNELSGDHDNLGIALQRSGKFEAAEAAHRAALAILEALVRRQPARSDYRYYLSNTHNNLGTLYQSTRHHEQAEASFHAAARIHEALTNEYPDVLDYALDLAGCEVNLGRNENDRYRSQAAIGWLDKAISRLEELYRREPRGGYVRRFLCNAYVSRARALARLGQHHEALPDWDRAIALYPEPRYGPTSLERAFTLVHVGRNHDAIAILHAADAKSTGVNDPSVWFQLARVYSACSSVQMTTAAAAERNRIDSASKYAARAGALIEKAHQAGYFEDPSHVKDLRAPDPMLDPVRSQPEFQALMRDLEFPANPFEL
jgi:tetratricopeptide (TPR) repeat protein